MPIRKEKQGLIIIANQKCPRHTRWINALQNVESPKVRNDDDSTSLVPTSV